MFEHDTCEVNAKFAFPNVDWQQLQQTYGWPALQYQAWTRTTFTTPNHSTEKYGIHIKNVLEYWVDDEHYFGGDFYSFGRAPLVSQLTPGPHTLELRLIYDIRAMGAAVNPEILADISFIPTDGYVTAIESSLLLPDVVEGRFASRYAGVLLTSHAEETVSNFKVSSSDGNVVAKTEEVRIVPGQTRQLVFHVSVLGALTSDVIHFQISYQLGHSYPPGQDIMVSAPVVRRKLNDPQKITFLHPGEIVSYAILQPPAMGSNTVILDQKRLPVILGLHGAGVEADSDLIRHSLDAVRDLPAWFLFPTGGTPWSGDDWHQWGWADVEAAIKAIPNWIEDSGWTGPGVDCSRWLVAGHSNGGQGTWYALANRPDNIIAAAAVSAYSSIQAYVPYTFWQEGEPGQHAIIQAALSKYRHELLVPTNAKGIPIALQHGSSDTNVPPIHSRQMNDLLTGAGHESQLLELPGRPHYWMDVMTTGFLSRFYHTNLDQMYYSLVPAKDFSISAVDTGTTSFKNGMRIKKTMQSGQVGSLNVHIDRKYISLQSFNVESISVQLILYTRFTVCK